MNMAITDGLVLTPPPFSAGLDLWSREDGTPGTGSYAGQANAAFVPADQDFGGCLELTKTSNTQKLRSYGETPIIPGLYLRVSAKVKAVSGNFPTVRIAGWAGASDNSNVSGVPQVGPAVTLTTYGEIVTVSAIIATGNRSGVDMPWGPTPVYGHFGLDLTGSNGGVVRIDDIEIEDVTGAFLRDLMDWVDVRDFGARGDGVTDDSAAFDAADIYASGNGVSILVSKGTYFLNTNVTFNNKVRFEGTVSMPDEFRLSCTRDYNLDTYEAAFGDEEEGFRRGLQVLFYFTDHATFDLSGRRVLLTRPVDVAAVAGMDKLVQRRVLSNGQIEAEISSEWESETATSVATYTPTSNAMRLTNVANVANIIVGSRVTGTGVGREIYVASKDVGAGTIELNRPLWGAAGSRTYTFTRYKYLLDFSGFVNLGRFEMTDIEFKCNGRSSGVMLPYAGIGTRFADCVFNSPKDRGITSIFEGCQGLFVDQCQFLSNEQPLRVQDRTTIALNVNANDPKLRGNRIVRFAHFAVLAGSGNMIIGNHFFQGDDQPAGVRRAGIVFTSTNVKTLITGNYIDNCYIEWGNEHDAEPEFNSEYSFGGLTVTGNIFTSTDTSTSFNYFMIKPYGPGHFINGLTFNDNVFRTVNGNIDRVEAVDTTHSTLDYSRFRNVVFESNAFNGVDQITQSPVTIQHDQNTESEVWVVDTAGFLPFGARARNVQSVVAEGGIRTVSNVLDYSMPYVEIEKGVDSRQIHVRWPRALKGRVQAVIRCDNPN
ncbi:right-handed parallel beta-helix repeat-containing protein [Pseudorhodobacter turbinis]|uniref:Right-handed parallel beta-helix repeat-containing protein n=1 Tax=Pseudorhodobacter turbinis TaxID=2500533 RepID=A0A4P8EFH1_9RHOB|nr:glycosyl hydrolase family 28-related protein [Pseudorhodobacter turbinis]QCO55215.1 right-handed parallel beta-helix repeat-containing protein [Pseudorhodobacter turbinis]